MHDRCGALADVRKGLYSLSQLILGANSLVVSVLSAVLCPAEGSKEVRARTRACLGERGVLRLYGQGYCAVQSAVCPD